MYYVTSCSIEDIYFNMLNMFKAMLPIEVAIYYNNITIFILKNNLCFSEKGIVQYLMFKYSQICCCIIYCS